MEKYNKLLSNIAEIIEKGLFNSKDLKKIKSKKLNVNLQRKRKLNSKSF